MKTPLRLLSLVAMFAAVSSFSLFAAVETGKPAPDFTLTDLGGKTHTLSAYKGKTVVLEWVNPRCPFVVKHYGGGNMPALQKAAAADGVVWLAINSAAAGKEGDLNAGEVAAWMKETGAAPAAYCRDSDGKVGKLYGAKTTPHMFVINADGTLVYDGAIDSIRSTKQDDIPNAVNYVTAALAAVKAGTPVEKANTTPYGCSVKY